MYLTEEILDKLNGSNLKLNNAGGTETDRPITLPDIMVRSFAEVKALAGDALSWGEKNFLYQQAQKELKENKMAESRILSRANPQLSNAVRLGIRPSPMLGSYNDLFPARASTFVKPGDVASMFSPAGYLTELYREAKDLHPSTSQYHLDTRRPDLASLSLSQNNMDDELSTLSLSNELLLSSAETKEDKDYDGVIEMLATYRQTGATPYHQPYEATRQAILLQDAGFAAFRKNPAVAAKMNTASLLGITANISPELHSILIEEITEDNAADLVKKNFGDISTAAFQNPTYLARYYGLTNDELASFLGVVSEGVNITPGVQYYKNDQLIFLGQEDTGLNVDLIQRTRDSGYDGEINYFEIIPTGGKNYAITVNFKYKRSSAPLYRIGTKGSGSSDIYAANDFSPEANTHYQYSHTFTDEEVAQGITFTIRRIQKAGNGWVETVSFALKRYTFDSFLLKLNKLIRLYKATGISPSDIRTVIESDNNDLTITEAVLSQLFWVSHYRQTYDVEASAAQALAGSDVSQISHDNQPSTFTRLFNTPPLNNQEFTADGTALSLTPGVSDDTFRLGVLKRALQVNDTGLATLWSLRQPADDRATLPDFACSIENISDLWRIKLLADVHNLSVTELAALISVSPYADIAISKQNIAELVSFTAQYTQWLTDQNWTVSDLYLMLTGRYNTTLSPDIENLLTTLKNGLANQDLSQADEATIISAVAPFVAAALQLDSAATATAILQWLDQLKPQGLTVKDFLQLTAGDVVKQVSFCQVMGQLALFVNKAGLTATELSWVVAHPQIVVRDATSLPHDVATLYELTGLHNLLACCGTHAAEIITSLSGNASAAGNLTISLVASTLNLDERALTQALTLVSAYAYFYSWIHLRDALQWLDVATTLDITPADVAALVALNYASPYSGWVAASHALQAGLNARQTAQLQAVLDEQLSAAVSAYVIKNGSPSWVTNRDELYSWLLIDNQVSAQVKTTRLAEAIASMQLYVNRALSGQEEGVDNAVKSGQFFSSDWDTYNKRYSTWAGVSELAYYPENYVDPTMRIGQTGMMDEMLQTLSQSQINTDSVENGLKGYLTEFEEVANLKVLSGYHDSVTQNQGKLWLLGCSQTEPRKYYWRTLDLNKNSKGRYPANAWSEWKEIKFATSPVNEIIRPVTFNSRLYVVSLEYQNREISTQDGSVSENICQLKVSRLLYDGGWSAPFTYDVTSLFSDVPFDAENTGVFCSEYSGGEAIVIYFYDKKNPTPEKAKGIYIYRNMSWSEISDSSRMETFFTLSRQDKEGENHINELMAEIKGFSVNGSTDAKNDNFDIAAKMEIVTYSVSASGSLSLKVKPIITIRNHMALSALEEELLAFAINDGADDFYLFRDKSLICCYNNKESPAENVEAIISCKTDGNGKITSSSIYAVAYQEGNEKAGDFNKIDKILGYSTLTKAYEAKILHPYDGKKVILKMSYNELSDGFIDMIHQIQIGQKDGYTVEDPYMSMPVFRLSFDDGSYTNFKKFDPNKIKIEITSPTEVSMSETAADGVTGFPPYSFSTGMEYEFSPLTINFDKLWEQPGDVSREIKFTMSAEDSQGKVGSYNLILSIAKKDILPAITINTTNNEAQYLQSQVYRTRVNTLFAYELIAKAEQGVDAILALATQKIQEPKLGEGTYVTLTFERYDENIFGSSHEFEILMCDVYSDGDRFTLMSGMVSDDDQISCTFFIPRLAESTASPTNMYFCAKYQSGETNKIKIMRKDDGWVVDSSSNPGGDNSIVNISGLSQSSESMDFSGANALYFWELFYYSPMMVFKRLLSESNFTEATRWLHYIWNPAGYFVNGEAQTYDWNVRPLEEETTWHADPLDSVDPDAVAQADPLHYKVATFMSYLDLLIARGDAAYRQLERDTLNEAKMWYVQALDVLGDEPYLTQGTGWASPRLTDAADKTAQVKAQQAMLDVRQRVAAGELRTANSLTALFLPQQNEKLAGYWQTLAQRLYNLRHNLSIDGAPLSLAVYTAPADPAALLSAAVTASQGGGDLPEAIMPLYRFPVVLESARSMVNQLSQFGSTLLSVTERQDAEALSELLQTQGSELVLQSIAQQVKNIEEIDADKAALDESRSGAQARLDSYAALYDEDVNIGEKQAMDLFLSSSVIANGGQAFHTAGGALDLAPNIFGLADGGSRWGAAFNALGNVADLSASATHTAADRISQSEAYRRRRQEWDIQRNAAQSDVKQINAQLASLAVRREAAVLQKTYLETQQAQTQAQMSFLQNRFSSKALYNWLRGKLAAIYYQFYDLTVSRCLMAQEGYKWDMGDAAASFIRPGAWQGTYAGLMAGETLMLNLAQMEHAYLQKDEREKEVTRTACLSQVYAGLAGDDAFNLSDKVVALVNGGKDDSAGTATNGIALAGKVLTATVQLSGLSIQDDYPAALGLGNTRRIKQISVTLPALVGPYQDVRAALSYGGSVKVPQGCTAMAVSHGMNDSGQFQLDFSDSRWLPFEGIPVGDTGTLTLTFPGADDQQKDLLLSLTDIILHIRYTIIS